MKAEASLPYDARSVRAARHFVTDQLGRWAMPDLCETAALLVSELVSNALLHARTGVRLSMERQRNGVRVGVADGSDGRLALRNHAVDATTGRGLMILDRLASDWGEDHGPHGKTVWFELVAVDRAAAAAARRRVDPGYR
jgi:anti-sigma regulatory factor (Ser/Thr protein kinase)